MGESEKFIPAALPLIPLIPLRVLTLNSLRAANEIPLDFDHNKSTMRKHAQSLNNAIPSSDTPQVDGGGSNATTFTSGCRWEGDEINSLSLK